MTMQQGPLIESVHAASYRVPTDAPESDGTLQWQATTLVVVWCSGGGHTGVGYTYGPRATEVLVEEELAAVVRGRDAFSTRARWLDLCAAVRNVGSAGLAAKAISAIDTAIWDLKARSLGLSLTALLGGVRRRVPAYGSGGFTSYAADRLQSQLVGWAEAGLGAVKIKLGRHPEEDVPRVRMARQAVGDRISLMVDANGGYDVKQALAMGRRFAEYGVSWFEEPVSSDDLRGLRFLRERLPAGMEVSAGEYGFDTGHLHRLLTAGAVDVLQVDATRCGGVTGFLSAAELAWTYRIPLSTHTAPFLHVPLACAAARCRHVELFHDHWRVERMVFSGGPVLTGGQLASEGAADGLGIGIEPLRADRYRLAGEAT